MLAGSTYTPPTGYSGSSLLKATLLHTSIEHGHGIYEFEIMTFIPESVPFSLATLMDTMSTTNIPDTSGEDDTVMTLYTFSSTPISSVYSLWKATALIDITSSNTAILSEVTITTTTGSVSLYEGLQAHPSLEIYLDENSKLAESGYVSKAMSFYATPPNALLALRSLMYHPWKYYSGKDTVNITISNLLVYPSGSEGSGLRYEHSYRNTTLIPLAIESDFLQTLSCYHIVSINEVSPFALILNPLLFVFHDGIVILICVSLLPPPPLLLLLLLLSSIN